MNYLFLFDKASFNNFFIYWVQMQTILVLAWLKSNIKVIRNPCEAGIVIGWVWKRLAGWRKESNPLEKIYSEEKDLISCQYFPHTVPLANTKWNHPFILHKPKPYYLLIWLNTWIIHTFHPDQSSGPDWKLLVD